jgi:hypothetical protein
MQVRTILKSPLFHIGVATAIIACVGTSRPSALGTSHFVPNRILVTRSTYTGTAQTVPHPGSLPNNAASSADGTFPNVFENETPDGSFGVTSPIFLDQLAPSGTLLSSLNVTDAIFTQLGLHVTTSFPSKSELGLHFTPDGTAVTFVAYGAPANMLDVSNSSTPGHVDITNPVNGRGVLIFQRDIVELRGDGSVQVTPTNTYSGNNGRNVVLGSTGNYYLVGNAGNNGKSVKFSAGTVTLTNGSTDVTLSGASSTANMYVGTPFSGANVPTGAYVTAISSPTDFTISAAATGPASGTYTADEGSYQLVNISFTSGDPTITVADTSKLVPGMPLAGTGFAANSHIQSIPNATTFVASAAPTANSNSSKSYTAGVSNSMLSDNTGVQMIGKGHWDTTGTGTGILDAVTNSTVVGKVNGSYGSATGYQRGFTISQSPVNAPNDKTGKDDNFRGITTYNNTLYVTKGSGGNGFDAVYQVNPSGDGYVPPGTSAGLPTLVNAAMASINPLPGWPTDSTGACETNLGKTPPAGCSIVHHPFGIWFANATTLYVADEGSTSLANAATGGLEKWIFNSNNGLWELKYTIPASSIPGYDISGIGNLQAVGLRNISGITLDDGLVTIYAITSTGGDTLNDEGADPNQLVSITDPVAATTLPADESFTVVKTAAYGDVLRGVAVLSPGSGAQGR